MSGVGGPTECEANVNTTIGLLEDLSAQVGTLRGWPQDTYKKVEALETRIDEVDSDVLMVCDAIPAGQQAD